MFLLSGVRIKQSLHSFISLKMSLHYNTVLDFLVPAPSRSSTNFNRFFGVRVDDQVGVDVGPQMSLQVYLGHRLDSLQGKGK